jgi:hypothetical protein
MAIKKGERIAVLTRLLSQTFTGPDLHIIKKRHMKHAAFF